MSKSGTGSRYVLGLQVSALLCGVGCVVGPERRLDPNWPPQARTGAATSLPASLVYNRTSHDQSLDWVTPPSGKDTTNGLDLEPLGDSAVVRTKDLPKQTDLAVAAASTAGLPPLPESAGPAGRDDQPALDSKRDTNIGANSPAKPVPIAVAVAPAVGSMADARPAMAKEVEPEPLPWPLLIERMKQAADQQGESGSPLRLLRRRVIAWLERSAEDDNSTHAWISLLHEVADQPPRGVKWAPEARAEVDDAITAIETQQPLTIREIHYCEQVNGFGSYLPLDDSAFKSAQPLVLYFELTGVRYQTITEGVQSRLRTRIEIVRDRDGKEEAVWRKDLGTSEESCRRPRRDYYVNLRLVLPESLAPGTYRLVVMEEDLVGGGQTEKTIPLLISD